MTSVFQGVRSPHLPSFVWVLGVPLALTLGWQVLYLLSPAQARVVLLSHFMFCLHVCFYAVCQKRTCDSPATRVTDGCELPCASWELDPVDQPELLTTEQLLSTAYFFFLLEYQIYKKVYFNNPHFLRLP